MEESRQEVMLYSARTKKYGLTVSHEQPRAITSNKDQLHCDYCGNARNTTETCCKLHDRPTRGHRGKHVGPIKGSGYSSLSLDEVQHLQRLLNKLNSSLSNFVFNFQNWRKAFAYPKWKQSYN